MSPTAKINLIFSVLIAFIGLSECIRRDYYISAADTWWDYAPSKQNLVTNDRSIADGIIQTSDERIGSAYKKVMLKQFTDGSFRTEIKPAPWMGYLGPLMKGETGDVLYVHFRNMATRPYGLHPHGVQYFKDSEGAFYMDGTQGSDKLDDMVPTGATYTYKWYMTKSFAPTEDDDNCIPLGYHPHVRSHKDIDTGLVGLLLVCKPGTLRPDNSRKDVDREFVLYADIVNETNSWLIDENLKRCRNPNRCRQLFDEKNSDFIDDTLLYSINGYIYGNLPDFPMYEGERVVFYSLGLNLGVHIFAVQGHTLTVKERRRPAYPFGIAMFEGLYLTARIPGRWLLFCKVTYHFEHGMAAFVNIMPSRKSRLPPISIFGRTRRYFLAAEEIIWDYRPSGKVLARVGKGSEGRSMYIRHKLEFLQNFVDEFDIITVTETHLDPSITDEELQLDSFSKDIVRKNRKSGGQFGGGLLVYFKNDISISGIPDLEKDIDETLWLLVNACGHSFLLCNTYRSEWTDQGYWTRLNHAIELGYQINVNIVVTGDLNSDLFITQNNKLLDTKLEERFFTSEGAVGGRFVKAVFREYTDDTFTMLKKRRREEEHMGIIGPPVKVQVGERLEIIFLNKASRPYSFNPFGLAFTKDNEGAFYKNNRNSDQMSGAIAMPGQTRRYFFFVPKDYGPKPIDPQCITSTYQSFVDYKRDMYSGLIGPLLICKPGTLDDYGRQRGVNRELYLMLMTWYEQDGWYFNQSISLAMRNGDMMRMRSPAMRNGKMMQMGSLPIRYDQMMRMESPAMTNGKMMRMGSHVMRNGEMIRRMGRFTMRNEKMMRMGSPTMRNGKMMRMGSPTMRNQEMMSMGSQFTRDANAFRAINGRVFGNAIGFDMCIGDRVSWHILGFGERFDTHAPIFEGNNIQYDGRMVHFVAVKPGLSHTVYMTPDNPGKWLLHGGQLGAQTDGMVTTYNVHTCKRPLITSIPLNQKYTVRRLYIAAVEVDWDYAPRKLNPTTLTDLRNPDTPGHISVRNDDKFIGSRYKKAVYREFYDSTFTREVHRKKSDSHLGLLGPFIKAEVGDIIEIVYKNMASFNNSISLRNLKGDNEMYHRQKMGVKPGETHIYRWNVPYRSGPGKNEPNCVGYSYRSPVFPLRDTATGLLGPLIICRKGSIDSFGNRIDNINREFAITFIIINETLSHYWDENVRMRAPNRKDLNDPLFQTANLKFTMNGFIYQNVPNLIMKEGDTIAWYSYSFGSLFGAHNNHFHGQTFVRSTKLALRNDVVGVIPGTSETVEMYADNPGTWLMHCHVGFHMSRGMFAVYTILPRNHMDPAQNRRRMEQTMDPGSRPRPRPRSKYY